MNVTPGSTDVSYVSLRAMTSAGALEGKLAADFTLWYQRTRGAKTAIVLSDLSAVNDPHSDGGIIHVDDGWYRLDLPDDACAVGASNVLIGGTVDGGVVVSAPIELISELALLNYFAPVLIGTVTDAGTGTEVFVYGSVTMTVVVDNDGNRSSVVFS